MKRFMIGLIAMILLGSCSSSKKTFSYTEEGKALVKILGTLDKERGNLELEKKAQALYEEASNVHVKNIEAYRTLEDNSKWQKIIREYESLQNLSALINDSEAKRFLKGSSYEQEKQLAQQQAAAHYYNIGEKFLQNNDKASFRNAAKAFAKSDEFLPGYKDAVSKMEMATQEGILNVVVNPVTDNSLNYNFIGWNDYGSSFQSGYLQANLVRDLGGDYREDAPARFYTDDQARRTKIDPDLVVDLAWTRIYIPTPYTSRYSRNVSKRITIGRDTSGNAQYETVSGTLYVTREFFTATGDFSVRLTSNLPYNASSRTFTAQFDWNQERATYRGDTRALSNTDLALLSNSRDQVPRKEDILTRLYQSVYPQVRNEIYHSVTQ